MTFFTAGVTGKLPTNYNKSLDWRGTPQMARISSVLDSLHRRGLVCKFSDLRSQINDLGNPEKRVYIIDVAAKTAADHLQIPD